MGDWQKTVRFACQVALLAAWPFLYLYYLCRVHTDGKYSGNYRGRMGLDLPEPMGNRWGTVWFHALSVGEVLSALPLVREVKRLEPEIQIAFSTATETGMSIARQRLSSEVQRFFFMPHDFPRAVRSLFERIQPRIFVLVETDLWPNLLHLLAENRTVTALVNGRISPGSYRNYLRCPGIARMVFTGFDLIFAQTEQDRRRFESLGVKGDRVVAAGNLKFDSSLPPLTRSEAARVRQQLGVDPGRPVWVAGSTHEGEEEIVLRVHGRLRALFPNLLLILAPRDVKRRVEIEALCAAAGLDHAVRSRGEPAGGKTVYLLDTLGELARVYALGGAAFIGGSLVPFGGHNPLEAVSQNTPACWGPHFFNFHEIEKVLLGVGRCGRIESEDEMTRFIEKCIGGPENGLEKDDAAPLGGFEPGVSRRIASLLVQKASKSGPDGTGMF